MNTPMKSNESFIYAVISGKGGVGKSITSINTAATLHKMGYRVALIDADMGLSNCATLMNEPVAASVVQWMNGACTLEDLPQNCSGITLVTGSHEPGYNQFQHDWVMDAMDQVAAYLASSHDYVVIDTPAGAGEMTLWALDRANVGILILVDEPTAISDVYRLCKFVYGIDPEYQFASIVNFAEDRDSATSTLERFNTILNYFLHKETSLLGFIPSSDEIKKAVRQQRLLLQDSDDQALLNELKFIAQNIAGLAKSKPKQITTTV